MLPTNSSSQQCLISIHIETLVGTSFDLLVSPHEQIVYIKRKIERQTGIPMTHQHLIWQSIELADQSCLHDYHIDSATTMQLVFSMRGGPVNTRRVPIDDSFVRDMSDYYDSSHDQSHVGNDLFASTNTNVTFLVLRDGNQFNLFQVIDRGDGTVSPLSGSMRYST
jgi:AN1-type zinc finger protein 4